MEIQDLSSGESIMLSFTQIADRPKMFHTVLYVSALSPDFIAIIIICGNELRRYTVVVS